MGLISRYRGAAMMGKCQKRNSRKGFTLLEVIVSIFIISLVAVTLLTIFASAYTTIFVMGGKTKAVNEAQTFIEAYYFNPSSIDSTWKQVITESDNIMLTTYSGFSKVYKIEDIEDEVYNVQNLKKVTVVVYYKNNSMKVQISSLSS